MQGLTPYPFVTYYFVGKVQVPLSHVSIMFNLPIDVTEAGTLNIFKNRFREFWNFLL